MTVENILGANDRSSRYDRILNAPGGPYDQWLENMAARPGAILKPMKFDPDKYPEQKFAVPELPAQDPYNMVPDALYYWEFRRRWAQKLGGRAVWESLSTQLGSCPTSSVDNTPIMEKTAELMDEGKNVMVVTSHFTFEELGFFKALRFEMRHDRERMSKIGTVVNKLMSRQSLGGKSVVRQFAQCSNVYFSFPRSTSSQMFGVPSDIMESGNVQMLRRALLPDLRRNPGHEVDIALTGKQIIRGEGFYEIPEIDPASASLVGLFDYIYGATMIKSPYVDSWKLSVGELIDVREAKKNGSVLDVVDRVYEPISRSVAEFTGVETVYHKVGDNCKL
ncbi:hypothetical protein HGB25_01475 [Candidatus Saccharibacteria bacterium]|nr:hypothetical protein [Candidatus Saccharibacteria bacterium]